MRGSSFLVVAVALSASAVLSGCFPRQTDPITEVFADSCKGIPKPRAGVNLKVAGIEIPWKPAQPVKIGKLDFGIDDARRVSDAIYALSESRQTQCAYISAALLGQPRPSGDTILAALNGVKSTTKQTDALMTVLATQGSDPKKAVALAEEASEGAKKTEETVKEILSKPKADAPSFGPGSVKIGLADLADDLAADIRQSRDIASVKVALAALQRQLEQMQKAAPHRQFSVNGFESGGVMLTSGMKDALAKQFSDALASVSPPAVPRVAIVGFADESGTYLRNIDIGLQRAKAVAAYLERNFATQAEIKIVSSGGVLSKGPSGRRVDLLIS